MRKNNSIFKEYKLIAHRGILKGKYNEYDPESIKAAINRGYYMLEVNIRETKNGMLILNHDKTFARFYNDPRRMNEMT